MALVSKGDLPIIFTKIDEGMTFVEPSVA